MKSLYLVTVISALLSSSCIRNPINGQREFGFISESQERQIGIEAYQNSIQAQGGAFTSDPTLSAYVERIGNKIAQASARPSLSYEFVIVNDSSLNAWALPGGKIAVNRGLLVQLDSEAELAAVLGHEITHAVARHGAKGYERGMLMQGGLVALGVATKDSRYNDILVGSGTIGAMLMMSKYSRQQELEADLYGMHYMAKAGYDPSAAIQVQELFLKESKGKQHALDTLFASHPPSQERIDTNKATLKTLPEGGFIGVEEYQEATKALKSHKEAYELYDKGVKALKNKSYYHAQKDAEKAIDLFPQEALFWGLKGSAHLAQKHIKHALQAFTEAVEKNPNYYEFYLRRAECKKLLGDIEGAKSDLKASNNLLATGEANELLGKIALLQHNKKLAIHYLTVASHAHSPAGNRAKQLLKSLSPQGTNLKPHS